MLVVGQNKSWYTVDMKVNDRARSRISRNILKNLDDWERHKDQLLDMVTYVVRFGFKVHRPLFWLIRRKKPLVTSTNRCVEWRCNDDQRDP